MTQAMYDLVQEYNQITGGTLKRFASLEIGRQRIANAKAKLRQIHQQQKHARKVNPNKRNATSAQWDNATIAQQRVIRLGCAVNGTQYSSVRQAFIGQGLPLNKHVQFRKLLRASKRAAFEYNQRLFEFTLTERP